MAFRGNERKNPWEMLCGLFSNRGVNHFPLNKQLDYIVENQSSCELDGDQTEFPHLSCYKSTAHFQLTLHFGTGDLVHSLMNDISLITFRVSQFSENIYAFSTYNRNKRTVKLPYHIL